MVQADGPPTHKSGRKAALAVFFSTFEDAILIAIGMKAKGRKAPYHAGALGPAKREVHEVDLKVEGTLPPEVDGVFLRNGPNLTRRPLADHHWFDGDGMIHAVRVKGGKAAYSNKYVATSKFLQEQQAGRALFLNFGELMHGRGSLVMLLLAKFKEALGLVDTKDGEWSASISVVSQGPHLMALHEQDLPYAVRVREDGGQETLGRLTYGGKLASPFTAHPKKDATTGELFGFGYFLDRPALHYFVLDPEGRPKFDTVIPLPEVVMMHDFAITQDYAIFLDFPMVHRRMDMVTRSAPAFEFRKERGTRIGVLPRYDATGKGIRWFSTETMWAWHVANAWQEGNRIRIFACVSDEVVLDPVVEGPNKTTMKPSLLTELTIDLTAGTITRKPVSGDACEFPTVSAAFVGRKSRYCYAAEERNNVEGQMAIFTALLKFDLLEGRRVGRIPLGPSTCGGEPIFVPAAHPTGEDDGYLLNYVTRWEAGSSDFVVFNAKTMSEQPVARVPLPQAVPFGFHSYHMNEQQFRAQASSLQSLA